MNVRIIALLGHVRGRMDEKECNGLKTLLVHGHTVPSRDVLIL